MTIESEAQALMEKSGLAVVETNWTAPDTTMRIFTGKHPQYGRVWVFADEGVYAEGGAKYLTNRINNAIKTAYNRMVRNMDNT